MLNPRVALFIPFISCIPAPGIYNEVSANAPDGPGENVAVQTQPPVSESRIAIERPNLRVDRFFREEGIPQKVRTQVDLEPESAEFFDLANERFQFSSVELDLMKTNGFAVRQSSYGGSFGRVYYDIYANDLPVLVTSDSILHALHSSYDEILMDLEEQYMSSTIENVLTLTQKHIRAVAEKIDSRESFADLLAADLYLTVGLSLLNGVAVPSLFDQDSEVTRILGLIDSGQPGEVNLHGVIRAVDFSQFKPRGHYTKRASLEKYFRSMMWMGRADTGLVLTHTAQLRTAATLALMMRDAGVMESLNKANDIIGFMVGESDNLTPFRLVILLEEMNLDSLDALESEAALLALQRRLLRGGEGVQKANSQILVSYPNDPKQVSPPPLFQMFGQREVIDGRVMQEVVFDRIVFQDKKQKRTMLSSLDVMAGLGNNEALALLEGELRTWNYSGNMAAVRAYVDDKPDEFWESNLYNLWLDALRTLHQPLEGKHAPQAMQTQAWQRKQLNTQLASWSQLRHDTILYAKQTYGMSIGCVYPKGAVEPYPEFYEKLGLFARRAGELFEGADESLSLVSRLLRFFNRMEEVMSRLKSLAEKQLAAIPYSAEDDEWMDGLIRKQSGGYGAPVYNGWYVDLYYDRSKALNWEPTIADVYTDPNRSPRALEVGVGNLNTLFAVIDNDGDQTIHIGPTLSFYEFTQPVTNRLTDEEWAAMLAEERAPDRPAWTRSYEAVYPAEAAATIKEMRKKRNKEARYRLLEAEAKRQREQQLAQEKHRREEERQRQERLGWTDNVRMKPSVIAIGSVSHDQFISDIAPVTPGLQRCYERHASFTEAGWREWVVRVNAGKNGRVVTATTKRMSFDNPSLDSCLLARFKDLQFEGVGTLVIPFRIGSDPQP